MDDGSVTLKTRAPATASVRTLAKPAPERKPWKQQRLAALLSPIILIAGWTLLSHSGWFPAEIVVPPEVLWKTFTTYWGNGQLPDHLAGSLSRLFGGYLIGAGIGIALGTLMGVSKQVEAYVLPLFHIFRQLPTVALIPAFIMIFGVGETVKLVLVAKATALPVALAAFQGVKGIPRTWLDVARIHRISPLTQFTHVIVPASLPVLIQGLRTALARSWMVLVAAELLVADSGIGQMMEWGRQTFRLDLVLIGVVITGVIGFTLDKGFRGLERVLTRGSRRQDA